MSEITAILGSPNDLDKVKEGFERVRKGNGVDIGIRFASAHRVPELVREYVPTEDSVIISGAGLSNALIVTTIRDEDYKNANVIKLDSFPKPI